MKPGHVRSVIHLPGPLYVHAEPGREAGLQHQVHRYKVCLLVTVGHREVQRAAPNRPAALRENRAHTPEQQQVLQVYNAILEARPQRLQLRGVPCAGGWVDAHRELLQVRRALLGGHRCGPKIHHWF